MSRCIGSCWLAAVLPAESDVPVESNVEPAAL